MSMSRVKDVVLVALTIYIFTVRTFPHFISVTAHNQLLGIFDLVVLK